MEEAAGPGRRDTPTADTNGGDGGNGGIGRRAAELGLDLPTTKPFTVVLGLAGHEALELEHDRVGTEHLLLGVAREGDGVAARALERTGAGFLQLQEAVLSLYAAGVELEPFPRTGDRRPGRHRPGPAGPGAPAGRRAPAALRRPAGPAVAGDLVGLVRPALRDHLRHPGAGGDLPRPSVLGNCEVSDRAGTEYVNWVTSAPSLGMVRTWQRTFVPAPPPGTEVLELRFLPPSAAPGEGRPLVVSTVVL